MLNNNSLRVQQRAVARVTKFYFKHETRRGVAILFTKTQRVMN